MGIVERAIAVLEKLHAMNIFPEVAIASLVGYFLAKHWFRINPKIAIFIPVAIAFIGEFALAGTKDLQDAAINFVMAIFQCGTAVGAYSMADKYNLVEKFWNMILKFKPKSEEDKQ